MKYTPFQWNIFSSVCWTPIQLVLVHKATGSIDWDVDYKKLLLQVGLQQWQRSLMHWNIFRLSLMCWHIPTPVSTPFSMLRCQETLEQDLYRFDQFYLFIHNQGQDRNRIFFFSLLHNSFQFQKKNYRQTALILERQTDLICNL